MELLITSEEKAKRVADAVDEPTYIISIISPGDYPVDFSNNPSIKKIFRMEFNDIDHDKYEHLPAPKQGDFAGLKKFVDEIDGKYLLIHCGAGVSRSAAVGAAINEYLKLNALIWGQPRFIPNRLVYRLACAELGIEPIKTNEYYSDVFPEGK